MRIVGVSACTTGIAHTYIVKQRVLEAAAKCSYECKMETQGTIGIEDKLSEEDIAKADVVLLAIDVKIQGEERFKGKPIVRCRTTDAMNNTVAFLKKIEEALEKRKQRD